MIPTGKGFWVWKVPRLGEVQQIADSLALAGVSHVLIKIADGQYDSNVVDGVDLARSLAEALQKNKVSAWGWQYLYSTSPGLEAAKAIERIIETGVTGFLIDAERECKGRPDACGQYCYTLRAEMGAGLPVGLSSYRYPSLHPELPWGVFRKYVNFDAPQVYWLMAHNAGDQMRRCFAEFSKMLPLLPMVPTGAAFTEFGWMPTAGEIAEFIDVAGELGCGGVNFWELYPALYEVPGAWEAICDVDLPEPLPQVDRVMVNADVLNIRNAPGGALIGTTPMGKVWQVSGRVKDSQGREWVQSGPSAHMAGWLCNKVV